MKNLSEKSDFDRLWENAFSEAEMAPSDHVWDRIDASLSKEETGKYRKRVFIYKLLTAASIAFAFGIGGLSLNYYFQNDNLAPLTLNNTTPSVLPPEEQADITANSESPRPNSNEIKKDDVFENPIQTSKNSGQSGDMVSTSLATLVQESQAGDNAQTTIKTGIIAARQINSVRALNPLGIESSDSDMDILAMAPEHIYMIPIMPRGSSKKNRETDDMNFIAGLDFSTGLFDPNFGQTSSAVFSNSNGFTAMANAGKFNDQLASFNTVNKDFLAVRESGKKTSPEVSFSYGANVGFKVSRRILLQTGIAYRKSNSTTSSNAYIEEVSSGKRIPVIASYNYNLMGLSVVNSMNETSLTNQFEFASVPLRAGYLILDRKLNLTVLAGVSSEFFLGNKITGGGNFLESISETKGESSPYKDVYFNGSIGTMLGYSIFGNYNITIEPGYRFAINSFTKDNFYLNSYPSSFMLAFGVTYNFK